MGGLFATLAAGAEAKLDQRVGPLDIWRDLFGGAPVKSGVSVTWKTALQVTTVKACVSRIAEALMCPMKLYVRNADGSRSEARDHQLYGVLADVPNARQSGLEYRETIGLHAALMFNHYSFISRAGGKIKELIPIMPGYVKASTNDVGDMRYEIRWPSGGVSDGLTSKEIWHIRGPSWDGTVGMDAIHLLREAIGLAIATEETHSRFHSNGAQPGGYLTTDKDLSDQTIRDRLMQQFNQTVGGVANKFKTIVLDNGLKWEPMTVTGVDAQHIQLRQFQVEEICRGFNVMPIMVGYSGDKAPTFASAEQMFLQHLVHTVRPWQRRIGASADRWLLTADERQRGYYFAFVEADFMSPDMKTKAEYYKIALGGSGNPGWVRLNEVRGFEELPHVAGGDNLFGPINAGPIGPDGIPKTPPKPAAKTPEDPADA